MRCVGPLLLLLFTLHACARAVVMAALVSARAQIRTWMTTQGKSFAMVGLDEEQPVHNVVLFNR